MGNNSSNIKNLELGNAELSTRNTTLEAKNAALVADNARLKKDNERLKNDNERLKNDNDTLKNDNDTLKKNDKLEKENDTLEKENDKIYTVLIIIYDNTSEKVEFNQPDAKNKKYIKSNDMSNYKFKINDEVIIPSLSSDKLSFELKYNKFLKYNDKLNIINQEDKIFHTHTFEEETNNAPVNS